MKINFSEGRLGFFWPDRDAFAAYLGVSSRTLGNWISDGVAPQYVVEKLRKIHELSIFPLDDFPAEDVLGPVVFRAYQALCAGDEETAEALSAKALPKRYLDWNTGKPFKQSELQQFYAQLVNGIAWTRSLSPPDAEEGLAALRRLKRLVAQHLAKADPDKIAKDEDAWTFLSAMTDAYRLGHFEGRLGTKADDKSGRRRRLAKAVVGTSRRLLGYRAQFRRGNLSAFMAWQLAKHAAVCEHEALFYECMHVLNDRYKDGFFLVRRRLLDDDDMGPVFRRPRFAEFHDDPPQPLDGEQETG